MKSVLFIINLLLLNVKCAKILGVFPNPGYSQFILGEVLMKELANRGHQVTVISPYSPKHAIQNYTTIKTEETLEATNEDIASLFEMDELSVITNIIATYELGHVITDSTLKHKRVQQLIHSDETFDLVIIEQFYNEAMKGFASHFNAPLVVFSSIGPSEWSNPIMSNPSLPSISPLCHTKFSNHMTFFQRTSNLLTAIFDHLYRTFVAYPQQKQYLDKYFPNPPDFYRLIYNTSLMLLNSHVTTSEVVALPYNMIEIGGFHVIHNPLDSDLQTYLDSATDGAILFSLGSNLKSSDLSPAILDGIFRVFAKLKQKVLWKFEEELPNKPDNVLIAKWLRQSDILGHPNVKLFITHGGLLGVTEAVFHGVPMVGIPVFGDQKMNLERARRGGIAKVIPFKELSEEALEEAINETINDGRYRETIKKMSEVLRDRVVKPLDLAVYWIEYTMRHKGIRFEPPALNLFWFQTYMIDIFAFALFSVLVLYIACRFIVALLWRDRHHKIKKKQQ